MPLPLVHWDSPDGLSHQRGGLGLEHRILRFSSAVARAQAASEDRTGSIRLWIFRVFFRTPILLLCPFAMLLISPSSRAGLLMINA
jgi:hypothetical protein